MVFIRVFFLQFETRRDIINNIEKGRCIMAEELNVTQVASLISDNGFVIENPEAFFNAMTTKQNVNIENIISELSELEESIENANKLEMQGLIEFVTNLSKNLIKIDSISSRDSYFASSLGASEFTNQLNAMRYKFGVIDSYTILLDSVEKDEKEIAALKEEISSLKNNAELSNSEKTLKSVELWNRFQKISADFGSKKEQAEKQRKEVESFLKTLNVDEFKESIKSDFKLLGELNRKLSFEIKNRDVLSDLITDSRDSIILFGDKVRKDKERFTDLCREFGLEKINNKTVTVKQAKEQNEVKNDINLNETNNQPDVEETFNKILDQSTDEIKPLDNNNIKNDKQDVVIENQDQLAKEIEKLNADVEIKYNTLGHAEAVLCDDAKKVILPEGFKYTEGLGFNNKVSDTQGFINLMYEAKKKELSPLVNEEKPEINEEKVLSEEDLIYEVKKLNPDVEIVVNSDGKAIGISALKPEELKLPVGYNYNEAMGINNRGNGNETFTMIPVNTKAKVEESPTRSSIPEGKIRVKKTRKAIVAPYVKAVMEFGALSGILGAVLGASAGIGLIAGGGPALLVGAAVGAIGQSIYNKMALKGEVGVEYEADRATKEDFEEHTWGVEGIKALKNKSKILWKMLKERISNKGKEKALAEEKREETPVEPEIKNEEVNKNVVTPDQTESLLEYLEAQNQIDLADKNQVDYDSIYEWNVNRGEGR